MTDNPAAAAQAELTELAEASPARRVREEAELVGDLVDRSYYALINADLLKPGEDPVEHFCRIGWRLLRKPNPQFDVWWYWANHLDPALDDVNPLVHYARTGRDLGLSTRPPIEGRAEPGARLPQDRPVRRACLFAGFDPDGIVDDSVLVFLEELSRHADVFYLADCYLAPEQLAKLDGVVREAWAIRHGGYDFGSYSMLADDLVGWERLADYDEVLLVNDSCVLVRPLDEVFAAMDERPCDWWGLQATKGLASTRENPRNSFAEPIPMDVVRTTLLDSYEEDPVYDFHLGSYFLALRRPVLDDPVFRRLLGSVHPQPSKLVVILKYEIGLTHLLIGRGHAFDTYVPFLHPFHPLFSATHFDLIDAGFPLLKRYLISQNHYDVPDVASWKARVLAAAPEAPVDLYEQSLLRTAPDDRLRRSLSVTRGDDGTVRVPRVPRGPAYVRLDAKIAKRPDSWVFAVDPVTHRLPESSRALFERVRDDPGLTKVVLTRGRRIELSGPGVQVEPLLGVSGREHLLRSGVVLIGSRPRRSLLAPVRPDRQCVVAVRDGLILEATGRAAARPDGGRDVPHHDGPLPLVHRAPEPTLSGLLTASDIDRLAALATHYPATFDQAWPTGLPLHDFLLCAEEALPEDYREQIDRLRTELAGRRLLLFCPSQRRPASGREPYRFAAGELEALRSWAATHHAVIGVREPEGDLERPYTAQLGGLAIDLSVRRFPASAAVLRLADAVLTDYSGTALDAAVTGRPVVSFAYDLEVAQEHLLYDLEHFFPGPVNRSFEELIETLRGVFDQVQAPRYGRARDLLVDHGDAGSSERALATIRSSLEGILS